MFEKFIQSVPWAGGVATEFLNGLFRHATNRLLKKPLLAGCSKTPRCKAPEIPRSEAYI